MMTNKIMQQALLLAKYDAAKDEELYCWDDWQKASQKAFALRRKLVKIFGEGELLDITGEEPICCAASAMK